LHGFRVGVVQGDVVDGARGTKDGHTHVTLMSNVHDELHDVPIWRYTESKDLHGGLRRLGHWVLGASGPANRFLCGWKNHERLTGNGRCWMVLRECNQIKGLFIGVM